MKPSEKNSGGRPRGFDREAALEAAMRLFWRHGYEGVSFQQLTATLGVAAPSLYAAFGDKAALYRAALDRYAAMRGGSDLSELTACATLTEAVHVLLTATADGLLDPAGIPGCMLNTGMISSHPDHADLAREVMERRSEFRECLSRALLTWVDETRARSLARYLTTVMQGMAIQARDGATLDELHAVAAEVRAGLERSRE